MSIFVLISITVTFDLAMFDIWDRIDRLKLDKSVCAILMVSY